MRELQIYEINEVSGAGFFDTLGAGILGAITGVTVGMAKGGATGGSTGGILGIGAPAAFITMIVGGVAGVIQGFTYGIVNGWDKTLESFTAASDQWWDLTVPPPKA